MRTFDTYVRIGVLVLLVAGCGGGGGGGEADVAPSAATVTGTVAVGRAVAGVAVKATCNGASSYSSAATDAGGGFSLTLPTGAFPCVLQVTLPGGDALRSFALQAGVANVTSLTEGVVALAGGAPTAATAATAKVQSAMRALDITVPGDPITVPFVADGTGMDAALDSLGRVISASSAAGTTINSWFSTLASVCVGPQCVPIEAFCKDEDLAIARLCAGVLKQIDERLLGLPSLVTAKNGNPTIERATKYVASVAIRRLAADARIGNWIRTHGEAQILKRFGDALHGSATDGIANGFTGTAKNVAEWWATFVADVLVDVISQTMQENFADVFGSNPTVPAWLPGARASDWGYAFTLYLGTSVSHAAIASFLGGKPPIVAGLEGAVEGAIAVIIEDVKLGIELAAIYSDIARFESNAAAALYIAEHYDRSVGRANEIYANWQRTGRNDPPSLMRALFDAEVRPQLASSVASRTSDAEYAGFLVLMQNKRLDALIGTYETLAATQAPLWITQFSSNPIIPGQEMAGIRLGDSEGTVLARLGYPVLGPLEMAGGGFKLLYIGRNREFLAVYTNQVTRTVSSFTAIDEDFNKTHYVPLVAGITIGSTRQQLVQALGPPVVTYNGSESRCSEASVYSYTGISFWVCNRNDLVLTIDVGDW